MPSQQDCEIEGDLANMGKVGVRRSWLRQEHGHHHDRCVPNMDLSDKEYFPRGSPERLRLEVSQISKRNGSGPPSLVDRPT